MLLYIANIIGLRGTTARRGPLPTGGGLCCTRRAASTWVSSNSLRNVSAHTCRAGGHTCRSCSGRLVGLPAHALHIAPYIGTSQWSMGVHCSARWTVAVLSVHARVGRPRCICVYLRLCSVRSCSRGIALKHVHARVSCSCLVHINLHLRPTCAVAGDPAGGLMVQAMCHGRKEEETKVVNLCSKPNLYYFYTTVEDPRPRNEQPLKRTSCTSLTQL